MKAQALRDNSMSSYMCEPHTPNPTYRVSGASRRMHADPMSSKCCEGLMCLSTGCRCMADACLVPWAGKQLQTVPVVSARSAWQAGELVCKRGRGGGSSSG